MNVQRRQRLPFQGPTAHVSGPDEDYATPERLAIYLEIGWSDFLLEAPAAGRRDTGLPHPNPRVDRVPPAFPRAVATLARAWAADISLDPRSLCDVGGATGRAVFEFDRLFPGLERLVLVEPSERFCGWARRLLSSDCRLPKVPLVDRVGAPRWVAPRTRPPPLPRAKERLAVVNAALERYRPDAGFDLITCLNVVDRHPCPAVVVENLGRLMNEGGLLVLSCPFDFDLGSTPEVGAWIDDLNALFAETSAWSHVGEDEVFYEFRAHKRSWTRFAAQVVAKRWQGTARPHEALNPP